MTKGQVNANRDQKQIQDIVRHLRSDVDRLRDENEELKIEL